MTTLQFADTHNLVVFLSKPAESESIEQIVNFLNANPIRYALTINPTIYTSCIEQLWATAKVKNVNGEVQLQVLVVRKKIIITEASVRRDLQLNDEEGTDCLPNATIFEELTRMGYKRIYVTPSHTKKIFGNMKRVGKGFSGKETPLFPTMVVHNQEEIGEGLAMPTDPHHTPIITQPSKSQPQRKQRPRKPKRKNNKIPQFSVPSDNVADEAVNEEMDDSLVRATTTATVLDAEHDRVWVSEGCIKQDEENDGLIKDAEIHCYSALYWQELKSAILSQLTSTKYPRIYKGLVFHNTRASIYTIVSLHQPSQAKIQTMQKQNDLNLKTCEEIVKERSNSSLMWEWLKDCKNENQKSFPIKERDKLFQQLLEKRIKHVAAKREEEKGNRPPTRAQQRSIMCTYLKNIEGNKVKDLKKFFKESRHLSWNKRYKSRKVDDVTFSRYRLKVDEDKETVELQSLMEVIPDEEEVAVDAIPLATKPPSIIDCKILKEGKISYFQYIRANGSSKRYSAFIRMLKSFDREDLETL
ncbi:hypothetical protein Tco_0134209 [Tanacetum coccineum]